jgi:DNA-directed RNA polymerase sigma subunit (sigma70/sigma32)
MSKKRLKDTSREGVFRQYMAGILKYPKLSLEEQQDLARKWRDFADKEAFDRLVKCNLRFVVLLAEVQFSIDGFDTGGE